MTEAKLKGLALVEAKRRHEKLQAEIKESEKALLELKETAKKERTDIEAQLKLLADELNAVQSKIETVRDSELQAIYERLETAIEDELHRAKGRISQRLNEVSTPSIEPCKDKVPENLLLSEKNYKFALSEVVVGDETKASFNFSAVDTDYTISITLPSDGTLGIDCDTKEDAEEFHKRMSWFPSWITETTSEMAVTFGKEEPSAIKTIDSGFVELGAQHDRLKEYYIHGNSLKGVLVLRQKEVLSSKNPVMESRWVSVFYPETDSPIPFVLSQQAITLDWIPKEGYTALPKKLKEHVPFKLRYWNESDTKKRLMVRNHLVEQLLEKKLFLPYGEEYNITYTLLENSDTKENILDVRGQRAITLQSKESILDATELQLSTCEPIALKEGEYTIQLSEDVTLKAIDWGKGTVYEGDEHRLSIEFSGAKLAGLYEFQKLSDDKWGMELVKPPKNREHSLSRESIDTIIEMSLAHKDRPEIAKAVGCCEMSVYSYQKMLNLL
jgi:hypothetical protein